MQFLFLLLWIRLVPSPPAWTVRTSGLDSNLRGVSVTSDRDPSDSPRQVVWACGSKGVILKSLDSGKSWQQLTVPGGEKLDFRGVQSFGARTAYVMSIGNGENSRVYKTTNGGADWTLQFTDERPEFFLDDIACITEKHCFVAGDPVDGKLYLAATDDGEHWKEVPRISMPQALPGEGAFAASSTTLALDEKHGIYIATGGPAARVFYSPDFGQAWSASTTPILSGGASQGIFSVFCVGETEIVVGGDYKDLSRADKAAAYSTDGGASWRLAAQQPGGFRSAVVYVGGTTLVAVGPSGEDVSSDMGVHWRPAGSLNLNAAMAHGGIAWGVGAHGTVATVSFRRN